jgi:hypothetical protein
MPNSVHKSIRRPELRSIRLMRMFEKFDLALAALAGKFRGSALMRGAGNPWFPDHALGAGCATWAWRSAQAFADEFSARMDIKFNYAVADFGDALPS